MRDDSMEIDNEGNEEGGNMGVDVGFKRASGVMKKGDQADFSFMKRRVRLNVVEKEVKEYSLGKEEKEDKKKTGKKYL